MSVRDKLARSALWRLRPREEFGWGSPWGHGRPGWHIECSTFTALLFGSAVDFHAGGVDLAVPHHANECTQNAAFYGCDSVRAYVHVGHLQVEGQKMSKSLKNFLTINGALAAHSPQALRMFFLAEGWRQPLAFSRAAVEQFAGAIRPAARLPLPLTRPRTPHL